MTVKLIAENLLDDSHFLSATEQAGEYMGQPVPDSNNTGRMKPVATGAVSDFTYSGTATSNGTTTTIIDSVLSAYGDDYFINGEIEFTGGANTSGKKTITDFAQATGTITWNGAVNSTLTGDTFTLTVVCSSRDFHAELVSAGDAGKATFKWTHDGTTYLGRDDPAQADWLNKTVVATNVNAGSNTRRFVVAELQNGNLICAYGDSADSNKLKARRSSDGLTWGSAVTVATASTNGPCIIRVLSNNRVMILDNRTQLYYSDNNGDSWSDAIDLPDTNYYKYTDFVELAGGALMLVSSKDNTWDLYVHTSIDGGFTYTSTEIHSSSSGVPVHPTIAQADNGDIVVCWQDPENYTTNGIARVISTDGGSTWGNKGAVLDPAAACQWPHLEKDIDGRLYCAAAIPSNNELVITYSDTSGDTWASQISVLVDAGESPEMPSLCLVSGHQMLCSFRAGTNGKTVKRGMWEAYSSNGCPCATRAVKQALVCNTDIVWHGSLGATGDKWLFKSEYQYAMSNIIAHSPSKPWRSTQDNIACDIVFDLGANERFLASGAAFFGCNVRVLDFQMNATDSWGSPSVDEAMSFDLDTGTVDSVSGNYINDASLMADYKDHELKTSPHFIRMTSGTDSGVTWRIRDNVEDYIVLDTTAATNIAATDTFVIFQDHIAKTFTGGVYRFMRISISAQHTADDYYESGVALMGKATTLTHGFARGYQRDHDYDIEMLRTPHGGLIPIKGADRKRIFQLTWRRSSAGQKELASLLDYIEGKNICFIPDAADMTNCYLVKLIGGLRQRHVILDRFDVSILLEEAL